MKLMEVVEEVEAVVGGRFGRVKGERGGTSMIDA